MPKLPPFLCQPKDLKRRVSYSSWCPNQAVFITKHVRCLVFASFHCGNGRGKDGSAIYMIENLLFFSGGQQLHAKTAVKCIECLIVCRQTVQPTDIFLANRNTPNQTILSGKLSSIKEMLASKLPNIRASDLSVSGAFHSPFMQDAANLLALHWGDLPTSLFARKCSKSIYFRCYYIGLSSG